MGQSLDTNLFNDGTVRRDLFHQSSDFSSLSNDVHCLTSDLTNPNLICSPTSSTTMHSSLGTSIGTDLPNNSSSTNTIQQVDPKDLQAFDSFHHGSTLNDDQIFLVLYLVDTFRYELIDLSTATDSFDETLDIYIKKSIFRVYMDLIKDLPEKIAIRIHIQVCCHEID
jgi:hypothetical protein